MRNVVAKPKRIEKGRWPEMTFCKNMLKYSDMISQTEFVWNC